MARKGKRKRPGDTLTSDEFFQAAIEPGFSDEFVLQLNRADQDDAATFSLESFESVAQKFQAFVMARTMARWTATGAPPKQLRVRIGVSFDNDPLIEFGPPWYAATDAGEGMDVIEGERRKG